MPKSTRQILVTSALPYANGSLHLGHLLETIQTDIWVRFQKMQGHQCYYVCADDAHGTAIMLKAEANHRSPEQQIAMIKEEHERDFSGFAINFDHYHSTHSDENHNISRDIYQRLVDNGHIRQQQIQQLYDPEKKLFLADRFVIGQCPKCHAVEQYGDNCDACGSTYNANELINPRSTYTNCAPELRSSTHYFFTLTQFSDFLTAWTQSGQHLQQSVANKLKEWLDAGLQDWDISRDAPYFGFEIPDAPGKYFYVWLDAPIGYMASFQYFCHQNGVDFDAFWNKDSDAELYHFIGKDIINFHTLFWPAMLKSAEYRTPSGVFAHGFLTINGEKMSKSKGIFVTAQKYLERFPADYLRYYFAYKLNSTIDDIDLNLEDFVQRVNSDLVGKVVNLASRSVKFIHKFNDAHTAKLHHDKSLWQHVVEQQQAIAEAYEQREYAKAMRLIMALADKANAFFDEHEPWKLAKTEGELSEIEAARCTVVAISSQCINIFAALMVYLKPVLPNTAGAAENFLNTELSWPPTALLNHRINKFKPLLTRLDREQALELLE